MSKNDFSQPVSVDFAPRGSVCEWCGKPAEEQLIAIGGMYHNRGGFFCHSCGEAFAQAVARSLEKQEGGESTVVADALPGGMQRTA